MATYAKKSTKKKKQQLKQQLKLSIKQKQDSKKYNKKYNKKHIFYIVDCYVKDIDFLNTNYLHNHLVRAGLIPDKAMAIISKRYDAILKKLGITKKELCLIEKKIKPLKLEDGLVKADVFFYYAENPRLNNIFYKYYAFFSNILSDKINNYIDKDQLYNSIVKYNPNPDILKYFIEVFLFSNQDKMKFPSNYIVRPTKAFAGKDIFYIHNQDDLVIAKEHYSRARDYKNQQYNLNEIAVSHIITDLALFKGRKFHIRLFYLVSYIKGVVNSFLFDIGKIYTAKEKFNIKIPFSKEVHDSHLKSTDASYFFPKEFNEANLGVPLTKQIIDEFNEKCRIICRSINKVFVANKDKILFENQDNGYNLYGLDILVKSNFDPVLIEINENTGIGAKTIENTEYISKILYNWINEIVIEPFFKYNNPQLARKHPTYIEI